MLLFLVFYERNICSVWKFFVFSSRRLTLNSMLIDYYFRSNVPRNLTDEFIRRGRWGRFAPLPPLNRNLHLWYKNENSPRQMMTNGNSINFCHLPGMYITDQRQIFDDKLKNVNFSLNFIGNSGTSWWKSMRNPRNVAVPLRLLVV